MFYSPQLLLEKLKIISINQLSLQFIKMEIKIIKAREVEEE